jgi:hypothetical protein
MKGLILMAALVLISSAGFAKKAATRQDYSSPDELSTGLEGKWGIGFDTVPGASSGGEPLAPGLGTANALDVRYWRTDRVGIEALLTFGVSNGSSPSSESIFGAGLGFKYNWKKPVDDVLVQWLGRFTFASDNSGGANISTVALWAGSGFEAFIPAWRALSVEGSVGLGFVDQNKAGTTETIFGLNGNGFVPVNVAVHYYFL